VSQISTITTLVLILFGIECPPPLKVSTASHVYAGLTQLRVCVRDRKGACLLLAFPLIASLYNLFAHIPVKFESESCDLGVLDNARLAVDTLLCDKGTRTAEVFLLFVYCFLFFFVCCFFCLLFFVCCFLFFLFIYLL
jgi:hypothetical protein